MLTLTKKAGYGLIALSYLASRPERVLSARRIAGQFGVPRALLMNVMKQLAAAGYVESVRGARGGYRLARRPDQISIADAVATLEGPPRLGECLLGDGRRSDCACRVADKCPIADPVHQVQERIQGVLKSVTLEQIARGSAFGRRGRREHDDVAETADLSR